MKMERKRVRQTGRQAERERRIGPQKDVAKEISSNPSKHDIYTHTCREIQSGSLITTTETARASNDFSRKHL
jgi:hypothetical protein